MHRVNGIGIGLTYVTGTLVQIGRIIDGAEDWARFVDYMTSWLSFALAAAYGALAVSLSLFVALSIAAGIGQTLTIIAAARA